MRSARAWCTPWPATTSTPACLSSEDQSTTASLSTDVGKVERLVPPYATEAYISFYTWKRLSLTGGRVGSLVPRYTCGGVSLSMNLSLSSPGNHTHDAHHGVEQGGITSDPNVSDMAIFVILFRMGMCCLDRIRPNPEADNPPSHVLGQPKWLSGSQQHFGWIRGGAGGESDRRVGLNRMGKMTPDINPKPDRNPEPRIDRVVWAK